MTELRVNYAKGLMDWQGATWLDRYALALPKKMTVWFFHQWTECTLKEYGMQINGYYLVLQATSPEGFDTRFVLFDEEIRQNLGRYVVRRWRDVGSSMDSNLVTFHSTAKDAEFLRKFNFGGVYGGPALYQLFVYDEIYHVDEVVKFMLMEFRTRTQDEL